VRPNSERFAGDEQAGMGSSAGIVSVRPGNAQESCTAVTSRRASA
jgi:hypothetical protein